MNFHFVKEVMLFSKSILYWVSLRPCGSSQVRFNGVERLPFDSQREVTLLVKLHLNTSDDVFILKGDLCHGRFGLQVEDC